MTWLRQRIAYWLLGWPWKRGLPRRTPIEPEGLWAVMVREAEEQRRRLADLMRR